MSTKQVTCRYFLNGVCREGSRCMFSHDLNTSRPSTICKYYQRGFCAYGDKCRYDHVKPHGRGSGPPVDHTTRASTAGAPGPPSTTTKHVKKPLVLRDKDLGCDTTGRAYSGGSADCWDYSAHCKPHTYLDAIRSGLESSATASSYPDMSQQTQLCPYMAAGQCHFEDRCPYLHGDMCEICQLRVLDPHDPEQRAAHEKICMMAFEVDMEKAFAAQQSQDKQCTICMEVVYDKVSPSERRFGILSSCCHTYCLSCIRQWRCVEQFKNQIRKSCPECRVVSEFVIPSMYWVEDQDEKNRLIEAFKSGVSKKPCKYFDQGRGTCPFGGNCFYMHAYPDGTRAEPDKPRKQLSAEGSVRFLNSVRLWDFIEEREQRGVPQYEDEVNELGELFMQLSGGGDESGSSASH
ncbi:E3 ubiquitin-protein ligase makorin-2 [Paramisgurnus dabryanus]|uniref:E3 ubiquitin-protein ligase makorin-2 n=1 Tax=Paramisgurnus dabryanus TaxID=90735 RepID=UPI0031F367AE